MGRLGLLVASAWLMSAAIAHAAPAASWTIESTPNLTAPANSQLRGVSCSSASACVAVGHSYNNADTEVTLAEAWNGSSWKLESPPNPAGAIGSQLTAVSCRSASVCVAVGYYETSTGYLTLAEAWNGSSWKIESTPNPAGASESYLMGVACSSASACTAVGYHGIYLTLAEVWNGSIWKIESTPNPSGESLLRAVSCASASACTAVGDYYNGSSGTTATLAEVWNGTAWKVQSTPNPAGASASYLYGVSCSAASACMAVGGYSDLTLAEAWNGSSWKIESTPNPGSGSSNGLVGVSCSAASACTAVGSSLNSAYYEATEALAWNGSSWQVQSTPSPTVVSQLNGVSCTSANACTAAGYYATSAGSELTLAEAWGGMGWKVQSTPNPADPASGRLNAVSCSSASGCAAVGQYSDLTLAEAWNGTTWKMQTTPNPAGALGSVLDGVACASASACTAVGGYNNSGDEAVTLAEAWNGTAWKVQSTPDPSGAASNVLSGVSCTSPSACTAVGNWSSNPEGVPSLTLAEAWNGTSWSIESTPNAAGGGSSYLSGVSCTSPNACTAVGAVTWMSLAEGWNGTAWKVQSTASPTGAKGSYLSGVSCTSASACTAVGDYINSAGTEVTLAEAWNGTAWNVQRTASPTGAESSYLSGVSCTSASACTAVGGYTSSAGAQVTMAEAWNGTGWELQRTPNPTGGTSNTLTGVSCSAASACTAAGNFMNNVDIFVPLAERYA